MLISVSSPSKDHQKALKNTVLELQIKRTYINLAQCSTLDVSDKDYTIGSDKYPYLRIFNLVGRKDKNQVK